MDKFIQAIGWTGQHDIPVIEDNMDGNIFIKFMSDKGLTDTQQGECFQQYLEYNEVMFIRKDGRKFNVDKEKLNKALGFDVLGDDNIPTLKQLIEEVEKILIEEDIPGLEPGDMTLSDEYNRDAKFIADMIYTGFKIKLYEYERQEWMKREEIHHFIYHYYCMMHGGLYRRDYKREVFDSMADKIYKLIYHRFS